MFGKNRAPWVGAILNVTVDSRHSPEQVAPAIVTSVKAGDDGETRLTLQVFLDTGSTIRYQYIPLVDKQPDEIKELNPERVAFWPSES